MGLCLPRRAAPAARSFFFPMKIKLKEAITGLNAPVTIVNNLVFQGLVYFM